MTNQNWEELIENIKNFIHQLLTQKDAEWKKRVEEEYKNGYNQCLKDQKLTGEKYQNLYL